MKHLGKWLEKLSGINITNRLIFVTFLQKIRYNNKGVTMKMVLTFILIVFSINSWAQDLSKDEQIIDSIILSKINQYRKENGLEKIIFSPKADSLSKFHDNYMINSNYVGHVEILGKDTIQPGTRINNENKYAIENVSGGRLCEKTSINGVLYETVKQIKQSNKYLNDFISNLILNS